MDENVYDDIIESIRSIALDVEGIVATEKCFIRKAGMQYHVDLHAIVDGSISVKKGHEFSHALKDALKEKIPQIGHVLIHIEPTN
jgi:divalent metal cation (Fe/Co/Zn/Cd) transporter